jgi:hypothetical protein
MLSEVRIYAFLDIGDELLAIGFWLLAMRVLTIGFCLWGTLNYLREANSSPRTVGTNS